MRPGGAVNVINMSDYKAPVTLPSALTSAASWLVWRMVQMPGEKKPRKIPYYPLSGRQRQGAQGSAEDLEGLTTFERAVAAAVKGRWSGVGLAMLKSNSLVAVDFDDCVAEDGSVDQRVSHLCEGTYSEISPSGRGVRAFFTGTLADRKDLKSDLKVEFFCGAGYVTVTGNLTPDCEMWGWQDTVAPLNERVVGFYKQRFGSVAEAADDDDADWLVSLSPKVGLTIEKARVLVTAMDADSDYDTWLKVGQVLHHEFDGSAAGLALWKEWSEGSPKYPGSAALDAKWASFGNYRGSPLTGRWLLKHSKVAQVAQRYEAVGDWRAKIAAIETSVADDKEAQLRETICPAIARDSRLDDVDREGLAQVLQEVFRGIGLRLPIPVVRKLVHPVVTAPAVASNVPPLTEFGNTERMLRRFGSGLRYVPELQQWYVWSGIYWRKATSVEIEFMAKETIKDLPAEAAQHTDQGEFFAWCMVSQQARMVKNMVTLAASDASVTLPASELDKHPHLLGVANGVLDLRNLRLIPADKTHHITRNAHIDFDPTATCPNFLKALHDSMFGDQSMIDFHQRLAGYILTGEPLEDKIGMPFGDGSNGKGTIWNAIRKALGDYAKTAQPESFMENAGSNAGGGAREDLLRLRGARLVYVGEPEEGAELREGLVKAMSGGDAITARGLYARESVTFVPTWTVIMPTNHKPIIKGTDSGIWRRILPIPYLRSWRADTADKPDPNFREKVAAESQGILAWMVEGVRLYRNGGLGLPAKVSAATASYRSDMDLLAEWLDERCVVDEHACERSQDLWLSWQEYARDRGVLKYIPSAVSLGRRMDQRFPSAKGSGGIRVRKGIRLKRGDQILDGFFD
jgi:putative DNA primase/helicase